METENEEEEGTTPFARAMLDVMTGTASVESLSNTLVIGAVRECIERVSSEYGLDVREVSDRFEEEIVKRHSSMSVSQSVGNVLLCTAITRSGKPCCRQRKVGTFCLVHSRGAKGEETKRRRIEAYAASLGGENKQPNSSKRQQRTPKKSKDSLPVPVPVVDNESEMLLLL